MFGAYVRGGATIVIAVLVGALLQFIVPMFLPYLGPDDSLLVQSFSALAENAVFIGLIAVAAGVLARAVVESNPRRI